MPLSDLNTTIYRYIQRTYFIKTSYTFYDEKHLFLHIIDLPPDVFTILTNRV